MERPGIELLRRKFASSRKRFGIGFFLDIKCADGCLFVYRCAISVEFLLLFAVLKSRVRSEQAIDQLALLILSADAGKSRQE